MEFRGAAAELADARRSSRCRWARQRGGAPRPQKTGSRERVVALVRLARCQLIIRSCIIPHPACLQVSKDEAEAAATQVKGAVIPITKAAPKLETVKLTKELKVGVGCGRRLGDRRKQVGGERW